MAQVEIAKIESLGLSVKFNEDFTEKVVLTIRAEVDPAQMTEIRELYKQGLPLSLRLSSPQMSFSSV